MAILWKNLYKTRPPRKTLELTGKNFKRHFPCGFLQTHGPSNYHFREKHQDLINNANNLFITRSRNATGPFPAGLLFICCTSISALLSSMTDLVNEWRIRRAESFWLLRELNRKRKSGISHGTNCLCWTMWTIVWMARAYFESLLF